jgi:pyruvate dehydrogenase E2 component (dihydrolipoamide acetyltransferase)
MKEFKIPELGENIISATITKVLIKVGDIVELDQTVLELETDKATIDVPSDLAGKVTEVKVSEGDNVTIGKVIFIVEAAGTTSSAPIEALVAAKISEEVVVAKAEVSNVTVTAVSSATADQEFFLPELGENIVSATVTKVLVAVGENIELDQAVLELETDKATIEVPSTVVGKVISLLVAEGDVVKIGASILKVSGSATVAAQPVQNVDIETSAPIANNEKQVEFQPVNAHPVENVTKVVLIDNQPAMLSNAAPAAPSVRRLAREIGVDVNQIKGSGLGGRILLDDVKAFSKTLHLKRNEMQQSVTYEQGLQPLPDFTKFGEVEAQTMSKIRNKTAEHLSYAWHTIPHVTQFDKADITQLEEFRKSYAKTADKFGVKLTVTAILVKIIASALKNFPQFNASVDMQNKEIIYKKYFNIGIAVDTDFGLIVPVIKNADRLNIIEISKEINLIAEKARNKKVGVADLQGGCFTITNLGGIGGTAFTPIINSPEVAILGISKGSMEPVYINGKFEPRMMLPLSLSYDHRVIDGADGIRFLRWIIEALENPMKLIIEG